MAKNDNDIKKIEEGYRDAREAYKSAEKLKYSKILEVLKGNRN